MGHNSLILPPQRFKEISLAKGRRHVFGASLPLTFRACLGRSATGSPISLLHIGLCIEGCCAYVDHCIGDWRSSLGLQWGLSSAAFTLLCPLPFFCQAARFPLSPIDTRPVPLQGHPVNDDLERNTGFVARRTPPHCLLNRPGRPAARVAAANFAIDHVAPHTESSCSSSHIFVETPCPYTSGRSR